MRRVLLALLALAPIAALGLITPAGGQTEGQPQFSITKVVDGPGPTGGFVIEYSCVGDIGEGGSVPFDAAGPGQPETQSFGVSAFTICSVTETEDNGAVAVTYSCDYTPSPQDSPPTEGKFDAGCLDDQTVAMIGNGDAGHITVTNTFEADELPEEEEPPAVDDEVVDATPSFTG